MRQVKTADELRDALGKFRQDSHSIGLVPTMGNLHAGHLALVRYAKDASDAVVVSIFVNPMQFDRADDLQAYPRTLEEDIRQLEALEVDLLFVPEAVDIYPDDLVTTTRIEVPEISERLEGLSRQGHFTGVATVVAKLFNLVQPDFTVFGEKDYQQLAVIRKMVKDLDFPIEVLSIPTVREASGLAMSSRNNYLSQQQRAQAAGLSQVLNQLADLILSGEDNYRELESNGAEILLKSGFKPDYLEICHSETLLPANEHDDALIVLAAAWLGPARLIDNLEVRLKTSR
jgi:pantoate--beta-alanine ligase